MWAIAQRLNVSLQSLIDANPQVQNPNLIHSGEELEIPGANDEFEAAPVEQAPVAPAPEPEPPQAPPPVAQDGQVVVEPGDSMSAIAARNGVSLGALVQANPQIADPNVIYPGQRINVPGAAPAPVEQAPETPAEPVEPAEPDLPASTYTVRSGDSLSGIAGRAGVSLADLLRANPDIRNPNIIYPGQQIQIPSGGSVPAPRDPVTTGGISPGGDPSANPYYAEFVRAAEAAGVPAEWASNPALIQLVRHESGFRPDAKNPTSSAFGMFQFLDSTWSSYLREVPYGSQDPYWQAVGGFRYIQQRYGTPERAWAFWQSTVNRDPSIAPPDLRGTSQYWIDHNYGGY
jgi:spore coat assembly protein SafA